MLNVKVVRIRNPEEALVKNRESYLLLSNRTPVILPCWKPKGSTMEPRAKIQQGSLALIIFARFLAINAEKRSCSF